MFVGTTQESVVPLEGYFLGLNSEGIAFYECFNSACGDDGSCLPPYSGSYCTECDDTESADFLVLNDKFECEACPDPWVTYFLMTVVLLIIIGWAWKSTKKKKKIRSETHKVFFKIVASAFAVNSVAISMFDWSSYTDNLLSSQEDVSSLGVAYLNFNCLNSDMENPYFTETLVYALSPWILSLVMFAVYVISQYFSEDVVNWTEVKHDTIKGAVVVVFLLQGTLTNRSAELLSCLKVGPRSEDWSAARI